MQALPLNERFSCRTVWISDVHLGSVNCKAEQLLELLDRIDCQTLYLVGDIVDVWAMQKRVHWPASHTKVLRKLLKISQGDTEVIYIPGNHDANFREFCNSTFGTIRICENAVHTTSANRRMLVIHGDELDFSVRYSRLNRAIGDIGYELLIWVNRHVNKVREWLGKPYWSLAKWVKSNVSQASAAIAAYQQAAVNMARDKHLDGIICGHLHHPVVEQFNEITYCNDGDWVENCTALVEDFNGQLRLIKSVTHQAKPLEVVYAELA